MTETSLIKQAERLADEGVLSPSLPAALAESVEETDANIRPGISTEVLSRSPMDTIHSIQEDLDGFRSDHALSRVVRFPLSP